MGRLTPRLNSHSRFAQEMRKSWGSSEFGSRRNEIALNFVPHQGHSSSGIGEGLRSSLTKRRVRNLADSGSLSPLRPMRLGGGGAPYPQADLVGPVSQLGHILPSLQFQGAHKRGRSAELIECQEAQRIAHQNADARGADAGVPPAPQNQRECRQP